MATNEDLLFVELALKRELISQEQADEILALKEKLGEMGLPESVADLMVKKGVISASDAEAVRAKVSPQEGRQQIKGYRLLSRLGRGGMGSVYKAVQISMDRSVALKVLKPSLVEDDQSTSRLRREAQLVGQLRHPNIVQGLDFGVSNGFHYFAMEYVDGQSVKQVLEHEGRMKEVDALRIATEVAKALEHAHQEGVVHRDIKPGNILLTKDGTAMLADYGLAKGPLEDAELTRSGVTVGTPQYISPEQAQGPKDVDIRTDIYSLGATLYHMLTGRPPYEGETLAHLIQQVLYERYAPVRSIRRDISPNVAFLVAKMMARKPAHRYQNPKALLKDLKAIEDGRSIIPAGWEGSIEALEGRRRVKVLSAIIVVLLIVGISGTVVGLKLKKQHERQNWEEDARQKIEAWLESAGPDTYSKAIAELEGIFREYEGAPAVEEYASDLAELKRQERFAREGNDLIQRTRVSVQDQRFADALRKIRLFLEEQRKDGAEGPGADRAREQALEYRKGIELTRDRYVAEEMKRQRKILRQRPAVEAQEQLRDAIDGLRSQAYMDDERSDGLASAEQLVEDLRLTTREVDQHLEEARKALARKEYGRARSLLEQDRQEFENAIPLTEAMSRLEPEWRSELARMFPDLDRQIAEANQLEWGTKQDTVRELFEDRLKFADAIGVLSEFGDRSIPDIAVEVRRMAEDLGETLSGLQDVAGVEWARFLPLFLEYIGNRSWAAAETELTNLQAKLLTHEPNNWRSAWEGARESLDMVRALEAAALDALDGRKSATLTFGTIRESMYDLTVDRSERSIRWSREPGGPTQKSWIRSLAVDDLFREAGHQDTDPQSRFIRAILRLGEVARMSDLPAADRELDLIESWIGEARTFQLLGTFPEHVVGYVREFEAGLRKRMLTDEVRAETIFAEAEAARNSELWQKAYDKYSLLLEDKKLRDTKYVRDREPYVKQRIEEMLQKLPGAKMGKFLRARVRHVVGNSVKRGNYQIAATWDFRDPDVLERWRFTRGRVGLVETVVHVAGPELKETSRRQSLLGFLPPENGVEDWLQNHPLRLESPLLYSRDMSISLRVRFAEPLAFVISLCGTNVVILSDDGRKENGRGVHIWQSESLTRLWREVPGNLRRTYIESHPDVLKGDAANRRYFQFEPNRWYTIRFVKRERTAGLYVSDRLVYEKDIKSRGAKGRDIVLLTWTPCEIDDLELRGTVDTEWYHRRVK